MGPRIVQLIKEIKAEVLGRGKTPTAVDALCINISKTSYATRKWYNMYFPDVHLPQQVNITAMLTLQPI